MKKTKAFYLVVVLAVSALLLSVVNAGTVSEEARRHMARGQAAVEMVKSQGEYDAAIKEFQEAARLAPDWANAHYNLGLAQEKAGKLKEAVASLKQYLRLAPNAPDAAKIQEQIYKLEYKVEQVLTIPEIIETLVSFSGWEAKNRPGCSTSGKDFDITRIGDDSVNVPSGTAFDEATQSTVVRGYLVMQVTGPVLKYVAVILRCSRTVYNAYHGNWTPYCYYEMENEIKVVSKTLVKVTMKKLSGGSDVTTCTFQKK